MMGERKIERGQVYYIRWDNSQGHEISSGRPIVIVSNTDGLDVCSLVAGVFLTTSPKDFGVAIELKTPNKKSWALCNQLATYDVSRFKTYMCTLSEEEMDEIDSELARFLKLPLQDASMRKKIEKLEDEITDKVVMLESYKRLYSKAVEKVVELKLEKDTTVVKTAEVAQPIVVNEKPVAKAEPVVEKKEDSIHKVNINTCGWKDLADIGVPKHVTYSVTGTRKKLGRFETVDELLLCDRFTERHLEQFRDKLEV